VLKSIAVAKGASQKSLILDCCIFWFLRGQRESAREVEGLEFPENQGIP